MTNPYQSPESQVARLEEDHYQPSPFSLSGRIGRVRFFVYSLGAQLLLSIPDIVLGVINGRSLDAILSMDTALSATEETVSIGTGVVSLVYGLVVARRRLHDLDKSGWLLLLYLIPLVNLIFGLYLLFGRGDEHRNRFGRAPAPNSQLEIGAAWLVFMVLVSLMVLGFQSASS